MSLRVAILKVLSGHPNGWADIATLNADLALLSRLQDWNARMHVMALRAPGLQLFAPGFVVRQAGGWRITDAGRALLRRLEIGETQIFHVVGAPADSLPEVQIVGRKDRSRRRRRRQSALPGGGLRRSA